MAAGLNPRRGDRRGSAAVEAALVMPVLLLVMGAILDYAMVLRTWHVVQRAARDGCRVGTVTIEGPDATGEDIEAAAVEQAETMLEAAGWPCEDGCSVEADWALDEDDGYHYLTVTVTYPVESLTGLVTAFQPEAVGRFTMMTQQQ